MLAVHRQYLIACTAGQLHDQFPAHDQRFLIGKRQPVSRFQCVQRGTQPYLAEDGVLHRQTMRVFGPGFPYHIPDARKAGQHPHRRIRQPQPQVSGGFRIGHNGTVRQKPTRLRLHSLHVAMRGQPANADAVCRGNICRLRANRAG